jgi:hypothetical protein
LKTARIAQDAESTNARDILRSAARACESVDSTDEALTSVGWSLRRTAGRPVLPVTPVRLGLQNTPFPGQIRARWARVSNARYYEVQFVVTTDPSPFPDWTLHPIQSSTIAQMTFSDHPIGSLIYVRVRSVGAKGSSPWSDATTGMIL